MAVTALPTKIEKPSDWLDAVEFLVTKAITEYPDDGFKVGKVKYRSGGQVGPDETCKGVLTLDVVDWYATGEVWPQPRQPGGRSDPCGSATAMDMTIRYVSCVKSPASTGGPPPIDDENRQQRALMDLGWHVYRVLLLAEQRALPASEGGGGGEFKRLGISRVGRATRLPVEGGGSGFTMGIQCKLGQGCS